LLDQGQPRGGLCQRGSACAAAFRHDKHMTFGRDQKGRFVGFGFNRDMRNVAYRAGKDEFGQSSDQG